MKEVETSGGEIQHLQQLVDGNGVRSSGNSRLKGSRFTHTEKLQFAQVNVCEHIYFNSKNDLIKCA